ncbi:hypothetical protein yc1106_09246 [Curvularia clavata]|uniref:Uncharacterized protein n=1 Tax=Curvularia clavata TaxID=95742 RepID=A0A9Q8ZER9_CURCL|nr:hypothetical protein yc1106_09246 [Curvularia clavata]
MPAAPPDDVPLALVLVIMSTTAVQPDAESSQHSSLGNHHKPSPFFEPLPWTAWSPTAAARRLTRDIASMNSAILADIQGLSSIPRVYAALFHRTRKFAATVRQLVRIAPSMWAQAGCLLVDWGVHVLRHPEIGLERFLNSQRESLYWILDDALLRICLDQWDPPQSPLAPSSPSQTCASSRFSAFVTVPWDVATRPIVQSLANSQTLVPLWDQQDVEEFKRWKTSISEDYSGKVFEPGWFRRSKKFLRESTRIYEIWRTMRRAGNGQLPAELANVIVEDVAAFENLPLGNLRELYLPSQTDAFDQRFDEK